MSNTYTGINNSGTYVLTSINIHERVFLLHARTFSDDDLATMMPEIKILWLAIRLRHGSGDCCISLLVLALTRIPKIKRTPCLRIELQHNFPELEYLHDNSHGLLA